MKIFLLSLLVAVAFVASAPLDEDIDEPVELIVNGVDEGQPLEIGDILGIKVKEHVDGSIVSVSDLLHPLTAAGIAQAAADDKPEPVDVVEAPENPPELPEPEVPKPEVPEPEVPEPEVPEPEVPEPEVPEPEVPEPEVPEPEVPKPEVPEPGLPEPEGPVVVVPDSDQQLPNGEVFNNGIVQLTVNTPESGLLSNVQSWFSMVINYFNANQVTSHQIV